MSVASKTIELILSAKDRTGQALGGVRSGLKSVGSKVLNLKTLIAGLLVSMGAFRAIDGFIDTVSAFENLETSLITVTGSLEGAKKAMAFANAEAAKSPYTVLEYAEAIKTLAAYGLDYEKNMKTLGDTAAAMGKPLQQAVEALADAVQGEGERLKEFGIKQKIVGDQITYTWVDTYGKVRKTIAENNPKIIEETLRGIWNEKYGGGMDRFSKTWSGLTSTLKSLWEEFLVLIGASGALDAAKDAVQKLLDVVGEMKKDGSYAAFAKSIGEGTGKIIDWFADLIIGVGKIDAVLDIVGGSFGAFRDMVATIINQVAGFVLEGFGQIAGALDTLTFGTIPGLDSIEDDFKTLATGARSAAEETSKSWQANSDKVAKAWDTLSSKGKTTKFDAVADGLKNSADAASNVVEPTKAAGNAIEATGDQANIAAEKTAKAEKATREFQLEMLKLASNEKIKGMEFAVDLKIEQLKADAKITEKILENIGTSITSTGDLLGDLFGQLKDTSNFTDRWAIQDQIDQTSADNKRSLDDAHKAAQQLHEMNQLKIDRLRSGDAMITVQADGLEPELRLIWHKVLETAQVEASNEQAQFLLGI